MALLEATKSWQIAGPLGADELWQCREGSVLVTREAVTSDDQGTELLRGDALVCFAGQTVRYRTYSRGLISREPN